MSKLLIKRIRTILLGILCCLWPLGVAHACDCVGEETPSRYFKNSSIVFSGKVTDISAPFKNGSTFSAVNVTFQVFKVWKGPRDVVLAIDADYGTSCDYKFVLNESYLVYAYDLSGSRARAGQCQGIKSLLYAGEDLDFLGVGEIPVNQPAINRLPRLLAVTLATLALGVFYWRRKRNKVSSESPLDEIR